jgi:hypothetical protein
MPSENAPSSSLGLIAKLLGTPRISVNQIRTNLTLYLSIASKTSSFDLVCMAISLSLLKPKSYVDYLYVFKIES